MVTPSTTPRAGADARLGRLATTLDGTIVEPGDPTYDAARAVWNGMVDRLPRAIVRAGSTADIDAVLSAARSTGLPLAVRGGGHNIAGHGTVADGIVLDLGALTAVDVDPARRLVRVDPGATLADIDRATADSDLAVPLGVISRTGVAGLALGGGIGWLTRACGLTLDSLVGAEVVIADGRHLHVDAVENPDLLWGLRGGGGNFGVVTSFTFRARPMPREVLGANLFYRPQHWHDALSAFERWSRELPDELTTIISVLALPPEFGMGEQPWMVIGCVWVGGEAATGTALLEQLRRDAPPDEQEIGPVAWSQWQSAMDDVFPAGSRGYWKNASFSRMDQEVVETIVRIASEIDWFGTGIDIHHMGGAFARIPQERTAFPNRSARFWMNIYGFWKSPAEDARLTDFARRAHAAMRPYAEDGEYVNFLAGEHGDSTVDATRRAYGEGTYTRLVELKRRFDPQNLFRLNHNIVP